MPAPAGRSVHTTGLPSAGQLAQRSRLLFMRRFNSRLTLGAGANNGVVACNQRTAMAEQRTDSIAAHADGGQRGLSPPPVRRFHDSRLFPSRIQYRCAEDRVLAPRRPIIWSL